MNDATSPTERSWPERLGDAAIGVAGGVASGAAGGPLGMAIGGALALARSITNTPHADSEQTALAAAAEAIAGVADEAQAVAVLQADPVKSERFRVEALKIRADAEAARDANMLAVIKAADADRSSARIADSQRTGVLAYATLGVSVFILLLWSVIMLASVFGYSPISPLTDDMATLRNLAIATASFWIGSSAGSVTKTALLANERARDTK